MIKIECSGTDYPEALKVLEGIRQGIPARVKYYDKEWNELPWNTEGAAYISVSPDTRLDEEYSWWKDEYVFNGEEYERETSSYDDTDCCGRCAFRNNQGMCHMVSKYTGHFHRCDSYVKEHTGEKVNLHEYKTIGELLEYVSERGLEEAVLGLVEKTAGYDYITVNGQIINKRGKTYFVNEEVTLPTKEDDSWAINRGDLINILVVRRGLSYVIVRAKWRPQTEEVFRAIFEDFIEFRGIHTIDELLEEIARWSITHHFRSGGLKKP